MNSISSNRRIHTVAGFLAVAAVAIIIHYGKVMLGNHSPGSSTISSSLNVERGPILDRNGRLLAIQTELPTITVWTPYIKDVEATAKQLSTILNLDYSDVIQSLKILNRDVVIKRTIPAAEANVIDLLKRQGELAGVTLRRDVSRIYPEGHSLSNVLGFTGLDNIGLEGIELTQNNLLSPRHKAGEERSYGNQIFLSIDIVIQQMMEEVAERLMMEHAADSVMMLMMDAKNGELLSYVSMPDFNPNEFSNFDADQRRNRPIQMSYEPGSVFKIFSLASFLHLGGIDDNSHFSTSDGYINPRIEIPITDLGDYGILKPEEIIRFSSNVGAAYASDQVDAENFYFMLRQFGFGQETGIELNGEEQGLLQPIERWSGRTKPTIAIGQEIGVTAIQMIQAASALANKGIMISPHIIRRVVDPEGRLVKESTREEVRQVLRPEVASRILEYMLSASGPTGTGRRATVEDINISVKTGTAEVIDPETGRYSDELFIASTLAIFPFEDPQFIAYVVIQHPRGDSFLGGVIAAPVIREVVEFLIPYLQIKPEPKNVIRLPGAIEIFEPMLPPLEDTLPDFRGLPLRTIMPLYSREDIELQVSGSGWVISQEPEPGSDFVPGMELRLRLSDDVQDEVAP